MVVEIEPPMTPDGNYVPGADGVYGPAETVLAADLGVEASSVGTAQSLSDGGTLSCDCTNSMAIWLDSDGNVTSTDYLYDDAMEDAETDQVFRLVNYTGDYEGIRALQIP